MGLTAGTTPLPNAAVHASFRPRMRIVHLNPSLRGSTLNRDNANLMDVRKCERELIVGARNYFIEVAGRMREKTNKLCFALARRPHARFHAPGSTRPPVSRGIPAFPLFEDPARKRRTDENKERRRNGEGKTDLTKCQAAKIANGTTRGTMLNSLGNNG